MKHGMLVLIIAVLVVAPAAAQTDSFSLNTFKDSFETFSDEFARSLPMNSTIGLNWSDAYIGQLIAVPPHFGIGVTSGVTTIPGSVFTDLTDDLGVDTDGGIDELTAFGVPLPGYAIDGRIGGFILPFDVGVKIGILPAISVGSVEAEYTNIGFDVRYAVLDGGILPKLSVGVGYNYLSGRITTPLGLGTTEIGSVSYNSDTYSLRMSDPDLEFGWQANVFDFKVQASKSFLIVEPHLGLGMSVGSATTETGLTTDVTVLDSSGNATSIDPALIGKVGGVDIDSDGLLLSSDVNPVVFRLFGGTSLNLTVFRLDLGLMYNISSGALGGTLGARFQL